MLLGPLICSKSLLYFYGFICSSCAICEAFHIHSILITLIALGHTQLLAHDIDVHALFQKHLGTQLCVYLLMSDFL